MHPPDLLTDPAAHLTAEQQRWLHGRVIAGTPIRCLMHRTVRGLMRVCFRLEVRGAAELPESGPLIFTPTHSSSLDSPALAAALPWHVIRQTRWAAWYRRLPWWSPTRLPARYAGAVPITKSAASLAVAAAVLQRSENLVWYPEGHRSEDGRLQVFHSGIGYLLTHFAVPVVPVVIQGTHQCLPPGSWWPRFRRIRVSFGKPVTAGDLGGGSPEQLAESLRQRVAELLQDTSQSGPAQTLQPAEEHFVNARSRPVSRDAGV